MGPRLGEGRLPSLYNRFSAGLGRVSGRWNPISLGGPRPHPSPSLNTRSIPVRESSVGTPSHSPCFMMTTSLDPVSRCVSCSHSTSTQCHKLSLNDTPFSSILIQVIASRDELCLGHGVELTLLPNEHRKSAQPWRLSYRYTGPHRTNKTFTDILRDGSVRRTSLPSRKSEVKPRLAAGGSQNRILMT